VRIEHAQRVAGMGQPVRNNGMSVRLWTRGQPLALPAGEVKRQRIGDESNELVDLGNQCAAFGISTLSSIERDIQLLPVRRPPFCVSGPGRSRDIVDC
jgi:hypothetical protein